jgi:hypothetical protein
VELPWPASTPAQKVSSGGLKTRLPLLLEVSFRSELIKVKLDLDSERCHICRILGMLEML